MPFEFDVQELPTRRGMRRVLVMTPQGEHTMDRWRLESLRASTNQRARTDLELLTFLRDLEEPVDVVILRGRVATGNWGFAEDLGHEECEELARLLLLSQLTTWRKVVEHGALIFAYSDLPLHELDAFNGARRSFIDDPEQAEADRDLLRRQVFFFSTPVERALERIAEVLPMADRKRGD